MDRQKEKMCSSLSSTSSDPGIFYFLLPNWSADLTASVMESTMAFMEGTGLAMFFYLAVLR